MKVMVNIIECPDCPHDYEQHADLAGCYGEASTCPCSESKATLTDEPAEDDQA